MRYRLYVIQFDEWGDEEERTISTGSNASQMETLFYAWKDMLGKNAIRIVLEADTGLVLLEESLSDIERDWYD